MPETVCAFSMFSVDYVAFFVYRFHQIQVPVFLTRSLEVYRTDMNLTCTLTTVLSSHTVVCLGGRIVNTKNSGWVIPAFRFRDR